MYVRTLEQLAPGEILAKTVLDASGRPLLIAGTALTSRYIDALRSRGILSVHVRDGLADDVPPEDAISEQVRALLTGHVAQAFARVARVADERGTGQGGVEQAVAALGEQPLDLGADGEQTVAALYDDIELLIAEILESNSVAGLESLKSHSEYTFQHSVDVAVLGVLLGKRLGMPRDRLRELALGCLLHDIGKTYIDRAILDKPGKLTRQEFAAIKEHPRMGYELIRRMPCHSLLPAHVAYQHHEKQTGAGYPRGLIGDNTVAARTHHERVGAGRMLLIAEIGAVADVYSALVSDRPYRAAVAPDHVATMMDGMAGSHLNRELVHHLRQLIPSFPVGRWVEVTVGRHRGWRGVVTRVHAGDVDRPTLRLLLDDRGEAVASPVELDTRRAPDVALRCLTGAEADPAAAQPRNAAFAS
jgi:HD-GYP domain-containing protein (c-di-GMP phosphodiesterase class II)